MKIFFWFNVLGVLYAYFLYPALLALLGRMSPQPVRRGDGRSVFSVTLIIPVHNEERVLPAKLANLAALDYPVEQLDIVFVSDGSTDDTLEILRAAESRMPFRTRVIAVPERKGKANALNAGLESAHGEIVVFSDASILLEPAAVAEIVKPFVDPAIGCVSGEDHIEAGASEGLYGRYELFLRNRESALGSIVGASGSFYAQRRVLCQGFREGLAPDFLSVLNTVEQGFRAVTEPAARGYMTAVSSTGQEFQRKVRTLLRGISTLFAEPALLNPFLHGRFAFVLISHKLIRWLVPFFLVGALTANIALSGIWYYDFLLAAQVALYLLALLAHRGIAGFQDAILGKITLFFVMVNLAILVAWLRYFLGERQELWTPTERNIRS